MENEPTGNAFEGESYTGKTTTIEIMRDMEALRESGVILVPEYSVVGRLPRFERENSTDIRRGVERIIELECKRTDILVNERERIGGEPMVLFDRGPISCIAFEHAATKMGYQGAALWMAEAFQEQITAGNIIVPTGMIYLTSPTQIIESRAAKHLTRGHHKILDFLSARETRQALNEAFATFGDYLPEQLFLTLDTGDKEPHAVAAEVLQFIKNQPDNASEHRLDFIQYAEQLLNK